MLTTCSPTPVLKCVLSFISDGFIVRELTISEGDLLRDLEYVDSAGDIHRVDGVIKSINFTSKAITTSRDSCFHNDVSLFSQYLTVNSITVDCSDKYKSDVIKVVIKNIISIGDIEKITDDSIIANTETLAEILRTAPSGSVIKLSEGNYGTIEFGSTKIASNITILGDTNVTVDKIYFYSLNNEHSRCPDNLTLKNIVFDGYGIESNNTTTSGLSVVGCVFDDKAIVRLAGPENNNVTIKNCLFAGGEISDSDTNTVYIRSANGAIIDGNTFKNSDYNPFNITSSFLRGDVVVTGNKIDDCFSRAFRFSDIEEGAKLTVANNIMTNVNIDGKSRDEPEHEWFKASTVAEGVIIDIGDGNVLDGKRIKPEVITADGVTDIAR